MPAGGRGTPAGACEDRGPARAATCVGRGTPARADAPRVRRPAWVAERLRGPMSPACSGRHGPRNPRGRPMPRVYGGLRSACRTPARAEAPCVAAGGGRPAEPPRGPMPRVCGGRRGPRNAREGRGPACGGRPAERRRGLRPRVWRRAAGDLRNPRGGRCPAWAAVCMGRGTPARTDAPRVRRPAECLPNARGRPMPPAHNAGGGRIQRPPKRLSSPLPGACRAAGPPGLRPAGTVRPRIRRHAR